MKALGLIETIGLVTAFEAADAALKAANVKLLGYENTKGGGRITVKFVGDVGAVKAAVSAGVAAALRIGRIESSLVIPRPHQEIEGLIAQIDRGPAAAAPAGATEPAPATPAAPAKAAKPRPVAKPKPAAGKAKRSAKSPAPPAPTEAPVDALPKIAPPSAESAQPAAGPAETE